MDNIFDESTKKDERQAAVIKEVGYNSPLFGTKEAGQVIGTEVELRFLYPVDGRRKTTKSHDHAIVQFKDREQTTLLQDVKLDINPAGSKTPT